MNHQEQIPKPEESLDELDVDTMSSVDDFIKELEAKEKDLHITSDLKIEIEDSEFESSSPPAFMQEELAQAVPQSSPASVATAVPIGAKTRIYELEQEIVKLNERIAGLRADRNEIQEKSDRRLKDFENFKYRMDRERRGSFIDQISNLASQMLPVLDNLNRALDAAEQLTDKKSDEFQQFYDGIVLVNQQVNEIFGGMGVQAIVPVGEAFDPNFHEAVAVENRNDLPPNTVVEEMLRGYRIGNRVIRHSMVRVTASPQAKRPAPATTAVDLDPEENTDQEPLPSTDEPLSPDA